jgi:hypothetical protein
MLAEYLERHDVERAFVRGRKYDGRRAAVHVGSEPVGRSDAPAVTRVQSRETMHRHRGTQIVADPSLVLEELGGDDSADRVAALILGSGAAASIPEETGHRIQAARLEIPAEDIALAHDASLLTVPRRPRAARAWK